MMTDFTTSLPQIADTIYNVFVSPGDFVLSQLATHVPAAAATLGYVGEDQSDVALMVLSLLIWLLLAFLVTKFLTFLHNMLRIISAMLKMISFRISLATQNFKMRLRHRLNRFIPQRSDSAEEVPEVEFDDLDLAVLRSAAAGGPAFATSALELADQFPLRPSQIQRSLDKLSSNKMLDHTAGSTDGFETYRLSQSGAYFMAMWQQKAHG